MKMATEQFIARLEQSFDSCKFDQDSGLARCEHRFAGNLRSVYFIKASQNLPTTEDVEAIQSSVVAPSYFASQDDSRWNHYLVFVVPTSLSEDELSLKASIETNTSYARKLVLTESEFTSFLQRRTVDTAGTANSSSELRPLWLAALSNAGLDAIDSEEPRASVIRSIRQGKFSAPKKAQRKVTDQQPVAFLRRLEITKFGSRSLKGSFNFGRVNLIRGSNGAGKTSLLEAIEHFLCGGTARANTYEPLVASASFSSAIEPVPYVQRPDSYYQQRDLRWYGRKTQRGNHLFEGFARYNFLNADAAVEFSRETKDEDLTSILSKVALGPDASFLWNRMQEFLADLKPIVASANRDLLKNAQDIEKARARLELLSSPSPEIASRLSSINAMLADLGWLEHGASLVIPDDLDELVKLKTAVDQAPSDCPASLDELDSEIARLRNAASLLDEYSASSRLIQVGIVDLEAQLKKIDSLLKALDRLEAYRNIGFAELMSTISELNRKTRPIFPDRDHILRIRNDIAPVATPFFDPDEQTIGEIARSTTIAIEELSRSADATATAHARAKAEFEGRQLLLAQLRAIGRQLAIEHPSDSCPLCEQAISHELILQRIEHSISDFKGEEYAELELERAEQNAQINTLSTVKSLIDNLLHHHPDLSHLSLEKLLETATALNEEWLSLQASKDTLLAQLERRAAEGYTQQEFLGLLSRCVSEFGDNLGKVPHSSNQLTDARSTISLRRESTARSLEEKRQELEQLLLSERTHSVSISANSDPEQARDFVQLRSAALSRLADALEQLPARARNRAKDGLNAFLSSAKIAYSQVAQVAEDIQRSRSRDAEAAMLDSEIRSGLAARSNLEREQQNLERALATLSAIERDQSLEKGLADFLASNLHSIQSIFERIHVPNELRLSDLSTRKLVRSTTGALVSLNQISTGQRAALVLSVFLTLNASLRAAPPLLLVDDPVAHVDDMNSLALLDYLADIAETGKRQIFFATADEKLANLFSKKMSFLGEDDFRTVTLFRPVPASNALH